jgi:hypothetical protein
MYLIRNSYRKSPAVRYPDWRSMAPEQVNETFIFHGVKGLRSPMSSKDGKGRLTPPHLVFLFGTSRM